VQRGAHIGEEYFAWFNQLTAGFNGKLQVVERVEEKLWDVMSAELLDEL